MGSSDDIATTGASSLRIDGRVDVDRVFPVEELIDLATGIDRGRPSIALVDVLARTRLSAQADVLVVSGPPPRSVALPVRAIMRQPNIRLIVETARRPEPVVLLDAPAWSDIDDPLFVRRISALTFAEFVMQR